MKNIVMRDKIIVYTACFLKQFIDLRRHFPPFVCTGMNHINDKSNGFPVHEFQTSLSGFQRNYCPDKSLSALKYHPQRPASITILFVFTRFAPAAIPLIRPEFTVHSNLSTALALNPATILGINDPLAGNFHFSLNQLSILCLSLSFLLQAPYLFFFRSLLTFLHLPPAQFRLLPVPYHFFFVSFLTSLQSLPAHFLLLPAQFLLFSACFLFLNTNLFKLPLVSPVSFLPLRIYSCKCREY